MRISNKCSMALHILVLLGEFTDKKLTSEQIASSVGCNPVMIRSLLGKLKEAGLVTTNRGSGGSVLAKTPSTITIWMVYQAVDSNSFDELIGLHPNPSPKCTVGKNIYSLLEKPYDEIKDAMCQKMKQVTLQQLLEDYKNMIEV